MLTSSHGISLAITRPFARITKGAALVPRWSFEQDGDERWRWKRMDESEGATESVASFASEVDCMLDAVRFAVRQRRGESGTNDARAPAVDA